MGITLDELKVRGVPEKTLDLIRGRMGEGRKPPARSKYGNQAVSLDGIRFASRREARRYEDLLAMRRAGLVRWFCRQPRFLLTGGIEYVADFLVVWTEGAVTVEDAKGFRTKEYRLKRRLMKADHGIEIEEV